MEDMFLIGMFVGLSVWFWLGFLVALIGLFFVSSDENWGWSIVYAVILMATIQFTTDFNLISEIKNNPLTIVYGIVGYFSIGLIWSYFRWTFLIQSALSEYERLKEKYLSENPNTSIKSGVGKANFLFYLFDNWNSIRFTEFGSQTFKYKVSNSHQMNERDREIIDSVKHTDLCPLPKFYKSKITYWIAYWPFSIIWTFFDDALTAVVDWCYYKIAGSFKKLSQRRFRNIDKDFE